MKKSIFTGKNDPLTEEDYTGLRLHFLNVFVKSTYKKKSFLESEWTPQTGGGMTQPKVRKRFLAEEPYSGMYQPGTIHHRRGAYHHNDENQYSFIVIGRYYTKNFGWRHYRAKVLFLSGKKKGKLGFVSV